MPVNQNDTTKIQTTYTAMDMVMNMIEKHLMVQSLLMVSIIQLIQMASQKHSRFSHAVRPVAEATLPQCVMVAY